MIDSFDEIQCEESAEYENYQHQLEYQQWLRERSIDDINAELRDLAGASCEQMPVDLI